MKLYQTPGGVVAGTIKGWTDAMKAEGLDPKTYTGRFEINVPTSKPEVMEWLTFHRINLINPPQPGGTEVAPTEQLPSPPSAPSGGTSTTVSLDELFAAAPISHQLRLAVVAIDTADARLKTS